MSSRCSAMARWPELEMGRNSATPWIRPRRMDDSSDKMLTLLTVQIYIQKQYSMAGRKIPVIFMSTLK